MKKKHHPRRTEEPKRPQLARDLSGFVWTGRGYIAGEKYDELRAQHPEHKFPAREDLPLLNE